MASRRALVNCKVAPWLYADKLSGRPLPSAAQNPGLLLSADLQASNRQIRRIESLLNHSKQSAVTNSNRQNTPGFPAFLTKVA
jgi:hypothetical protein